MPVIKGMVTDASGNPAMGRVVRLYRRDTGAFLTSTQTSSGEPEEAPLVDPYWSQTTLIMPMDGVDGATTFSDVKGGTLTTIGNAHISADASVFGGASAYFDGAASAVETAVADAYGFEAGDFTIELFVSGDPVQPNTYPVIIGGGLSWTTSSWMLQLDHAAYRGKPSLLCYGKGGDILVGTTNLMDGQWHHVAVTRFGNTWRLFIDGVLNVEASFSGNLNGATGKLRIGGGEGSNEAMKGYLDDIRVTKGVARYLANFTPPTAPVPITEYGDVLPAGEYAAHISYIGEVQRVVLDDVAGDTYNDLIDRVEAS